MKLRYVHLRDYPPLEDIEIVPAAQSLLPRECAIRFVVGVNGSGKSNLLRALAEVFLALAEQRPTHFPVSLVYELGRKGEERTILLDFPGRRSEASLWIREKFSYPAAAAAATFAAIFESLQGDQPPEGFAPLLARGAWPTGSATPPAIALPRTVLAYTTGAPAPWEALWQRVSDVGGIDLVSQSEEYETERERPIGWTARQEAELAAEWAARDASVWVPDSGPPATGTPASGTPASGTSDGLENQDALSLSAAWRPIFITAALLKCALLAVALPVGLADLEMAVNATAVAAPDAEPKLRSLLERAGWKWPLSVAVRLDFRPDSWRDEQVRRVQPWLEAAGEVIAEPPPGTRRALHFDLRGATVADASQGAALLTLLGGAAISPYERFERLKGLLDSGFIEDLQICLARTDMTDVLRFDELSDGEQMVLGRMALFYLLENEHDAFLMLDEPETHFNDKWKREIIDIIDSAIGDTANEVWNATHTAIMLTDAFNDEIILLERTAEGGAIVRPVSAKTFAADPSTVIMEVFGATDSVGKRALEYIHSRIIGDTLTPEDLDNIEILIGRMGPGFYRSELRTFVIERRQHAQGS